MNKKGIGPVIASSLLIVVAVVAIIGFQTWFNSYSTTLFSDVESKSSSSVSQTKIDQLLGDTLYFRNGFTENLTITDVKIGGNSCNLGSLTANGDSLTQISLNSNCTTNLTSSKIEAVVYTNKGPYSTYFYNRNVSASTSLSSNSSEEESVSSSSSYGASNSLLFNDGDSAYLNRTPGVEGNRTTWTWSGWIKRGTLDTWQGIFNGYQDGNNFAGLYFRNTNQLHFSTQRGSGYVAYASTDALFRDINNWNHIVLYHDSTQASLSDAIKIYVNGELQSLNANGYTWSSGNDVINGQYVHAIGSNAAASNYFDGYMSDVNFVDGQALGPEYFGENDSYGNWIPKEFNVTNTSKGSYGTNGFYLPFNQSTNLGRDFSGNANNFTVNNIEEGQGLLIHSDNSDGSTIFVDSSGIGHSITANGDVSHETNNSKFSNSSIYFDGSGDYLSISDTSELEFGTGDFTIDFWFNPNDLSAYQTLFSKWGSGPTSNKGWAIHSTGSQGEILFQASNDGNSEIANLYSGSLLNISENSWHHIAVTRYGNNFSLYINGTRVSSTSSSSTIYNNDREIRIGARDYGSSPDYSSGYFDEIRITKGKALWTRDFTPPTASATILDAPSDDQVTDVPTNNFAILNPITTGSGTFSNGNLDITSSNLAGEVATLGVSSGKWYWEVDQTGNGGEVGVYSSHTDLSQSSGNQNDGVGNWVLNFNGRYHDNPIGGTLTTSTPDNSSWAFDSTNTIMVALDMDEGKIWFGIDGVWLDNSSDVIGDPSNNIGAFLNGITGEVFSMVGDGTGIATNSQRINFGQLSSLSGSSTTYNSSAGGSFVYTPPSGFKALSVNNINNITGKVNASEFFDTILYTGNSAVRNITGLSFSPDLVWIKNRDTTDEHKLIDSLRGVTKELSSDSTAVEGTDSNGLTNFNSDGFELGTGASGYNDNTEDFVSWNWKENESIFDIVSYTGTATARSINHSLGVVPALMIFKNLDTTNSWTIYHQSVSNLNVNGAPANNFFTFTSNALDTNVLNTPTFNRTQPTSEVFTIGTNVGVNGNTNRMIAYLFAEKEGFSKIGSYTGNGNTDGPVIYTGFKPAFVMIKRTDSTGDWRIQDSKRVGYNPFDGYLRASTTEAENTAGYFDFLSNGFKLRNAGAEVNANSGSFIYIAFAEKPLN